MAKKKYNLLMNGNKPLGDKWNFDKESKSISKLKKFQKKTQNKIR